MGSINFRFLVTPVGLLRLLTTIFLVISIALGGHAFEHSLYNSYYRFWEEAFPGAPDDYGAPGLGRERSFIGLTATVLILAVFLLFDRLFSSAEESDSGMSSRMKIDLAFHGIGAVLLLIAGSLLLDSSRRISSSGCDIMRESNSRLKDHKCQRGGEKVFGGIFALATAGLYVLIIVLQVVPGLVRARSPPATNAESGTRGGRWPWM